MLETEEVGVGGVIVSGIREWVSHTEAKQVRKE